MATLIDNSFCCSKFDVTCMNGCMPEINWFNGKSVAFYGDVSMLGWTTPSLTPIPSILKSMLNLKDADVYASSFARLSTPAGSTVYLKDIITATPAKYDAGIVMIGAYDYDADRELGEYPQSETSYSYDALTTTVSNGIALACIEWQTKFTGPLIWITYPPRSNDPLTLNSASSAYNWLGLDEVTYAIAGFLFQCPIIDSSNYTSYGAWTEERNMEYCRVLAHELGKIFV
jgi:hypothetical protein